jgi:UDP-glucuronate 4-epimerase
MILITGVAGFIGMHIAEKLLQRGDEVVGLDNLNNYYDPILKLMRLENLKKYPSFRFIKGDLVDRKLMAELFESVKFNGVIHLAAQAGVRYSVTNPYSYVDSNLVGFLNVLEGCRHNNNAHLVYASSSSVYGGNEKMPFSEEDSVDHPVSLYAVTKRANELMAHSYSHLYNLPVTGLRFFTVYGPWGRPDMSLFLFVNAILNKEPIKVFNDGKMRRDFTYIDDIVEGVIRILDKPATSEQNFDGKKPMPHIGCAPYRIFNIGNSNPVPLMDFIEAIENSLGMTAEKIFLPLQAGDVAETYADIDELDAWVGFKPATEVKDGIGRFIDWYLDYYQINLPQKNENSHSN